MALNESLCPKDDFRPVHRLTSKACEIKPKTTDHYRKSYARSIGAKFDDLEWPLAHVRENFRSSPCDHAQHNGNDLDLLSCQWHTFNEKTSEAHIWETITATATLSCTVIQLEMVLQGRWNRWPWPSQKLKTPWPTFATWHTFKKLIAAAFGIYCSRSLAYDCSV